jgi:hypothetical protein
MNAAEAAQLAREQGVLKCPACGVRQLSCFITEAEIGRWCCGDCTAHRGQHDWDFS